MEDNAEMSNTVSQKRRKSEENLNEDDSKPKKPRLYSAKEFRKKLGSSEKLNALKEFSSIINNSSAHDYVFDYLKSGGNCLELLQTLEGDSAIPPTVVLDLVTQLLLRINAKYGQYYSSAHEACKYLLNNYLPLIHKMLGLSSSKEERKVCLKLLTAMAAFSPNLAKDILLKVKFHSANIELLTKHTGEKNSVRDCFVHFLTAFLVDGDLHTLSILLEKSGLLTGIISGLQYDAADTVCIVVAAMKNHVLENSAVMKTTKMHVFNTAVVKDIVNLYNWKGPEGLRALDKTNRTIFEVDKIAKSKVSECVHDFLLVLCTSHKNGVIFKDHLVGLGKKNQNGLMYTVLDSLDRPWEHSYASELVIKICRACPDLTKNLWSILKPFLEPRLTEKWLSAMNFARKLVKEMEPTCIEYCANGLNPQQMAQIIEFLVSPSPILKILRVESDANNNSEIKRHISVLLYDMLEKLDKYLHTSNTWTSIDSYKKIKHYLSNYITRNYPNGQHLLEDWKRLCLEENVEDSKNMSGNNKYIYLETVLNILNLYKSIAPQLLNNLVSSNLDLKDLLKLSVDSDEEREKLETLQMKIIGIFVDIDHAYFLPKTEIFSQILPLLLKMYHKERTRELQLVLHKLLKNTGVFDSSLYEINIWLNGIFNFNVFTESFAENLVQLFRNVTDNILEYQKELSQVNVEESIDEKSVEMIEALLDSSEGSEDSVRPMKHRHLSPVIVGFLKYLQENDVSKNMKKYLEFVLFNLFHCQTVLDTFFSVTQRYSENVPSNILNYIQSWSQGSCEPLAKIKGSLDIFKTLSETFLSDIVSENDLENVIYPDFLIDVLRIFTFWFSNLVTHGLVTENHSKNWIFLIEYINNQNLFAEVCSETVLENPNLIRNFNIIHFGKTTSGGICTDAIFKVVKELGKLNYIEDYIKIYSNSIFNNIVKILRKPKKYLNQQNSQYLTDILNVFPLGYNDCSKILNHTSELLNDKFEIANNATLLEILTYSLGRILFLCNNNPDLKPIDKSLIARISSYLVILNRENKNSGSLSKTLRSYLESFPHSISHLDENLFSSLLTLSEYNKDNADLAVFLLQNNLKLTKEIEDNIDSVVEKKGLVLPIVHVLVNSGGPDSFLKIIYEKLEASILKAIQKPQKVGQHFLKNYDIGALVEKFMPLEKCKPYADKVQKFEVAELFHVKLLEACYTRLINEGEVSEKQVGSIIMTFIHLEIALLKKKTNSDEDAIKVDEVSNVFNDILEKIKPKTSNKHFPQITNNETFKTFCKFTLKFGVSGQHILLRLLRNIIGFLTESLGKDEASLLLDMMLSHSEFLNVVLGERSETKLEVLTLILTICRNWNELMEKSHVAVVLSAYRGMVTRCDRTVLELLKLYESKAEQTRFYDFKPFLWGRAAAAHYSVRTKIESSLTMQPKISDVLGIIKEDLVNSTITNYLFKDGLHQEGEIIDEDTKCYDLKFLLPLFSHILAPEQQVKTYMFSRSGALSLTVVGLSSLDKEVRQAACHVLSRFHFHLEARQTGKDNLLWIRFVEALCKGTAVLPNFKLNNFASIFYARMALILTNPRHVMYTPLSLYLTAKQDLDLSTVPELYTLLFSSDVNYKEHRNFILEILRDGLRTEKDFVDFSKSMGFKLFSELFTSCVSDIDSRLLIMDILEGACKISIGVKILCENYALLPQLCTFTSNSTGDIKVLSKLLGIFLAILKIRHDLYTNQLVFDVFLDILKSENFLQLKEPDAACVYEILYTIFNNNCDVFSNKDVFLTLLLEKANDKFCHYLRNYGCEFVTEKSSNLQIKDKFYFLRLLVYKLLI